MLKPSVQTHNEDGILIAEFWDCLRLDPVPVQDLRSKYETHMRNGGRPELIIDLLGVGFAGSAVLGHFMMLHRLARSKNGRLVFCNVDPTVYEVFKVTKLVSFFTFVNDRAAALNEVKNPTPATHPHETSAEGADAGMVPPSPPEPRNSGGGGLLRSSRRRNLS